MIKHIIERLSGSKIYRHSIPRGCDLIADLKNKTKQFDPKIIFDVGAHHGETAKLFARSFPSASIHSFEPVTPNFSELVSNCNGFSNIHCENIALGATVGKGVMFIGAASTAHSLVEELNHSDSGTKEEVEIKTVDSYVKEKNIPEISLLKVDAEGYDLEVLKGAEQIIQRQSVPFIFVESGFDERFVPLEVLYNHLHKRDYDIFGIYDQTAYWWGRNFLWNMNVLFIHRSSQ